MYPMPLSSPLQGATALPLSVFSEAGAAKAPVSARADRLSQVIVRLGRISLLRQHAGRMSEIEDYAKCSHETVTVCLSPASRGLRQTG